ncbi:MAG: hypothetical protein CML20_19380 [Rheinheimera sp.]|nr:hypothetical protein [Rheinheimera sp.]|tara:strand:+ start:12528 stop:12971 length:444 start_codon:yes stop_codon:yes gene_type:complete
MSFTIYLAVFDSGKITLNQLTEWLGLFDMIIELDETDSQHDFIALKQNVLTSVAEHGVIVDSQTHMSYYRFKISIGNSWLRNLISTLDETKQATRHSLIKPLVHKQKHQALNRYEHANLRRHRKNCATRSAMQQKLSDALLLWEFSL